MPNFDALRSAIIGPLEYICRPKLAPAELLCCCPLSPNTLTDKSRYNNTCIIPSGTWSDSYGLSACTGNSLSISLNKPLNLGSPWVFEMCIAATSSLADNRTLRLQFGGYSLCFVKHTTTYAMSIIYINGTQTQYPDFTYNSLTHLGIIYNSGKVGLYYNGQRVNEATVTLSGTQSSISYQSLANLYINNIRLIQTAKTEGGTFPYATPATYYTGYEVL